jgi:nucleoside-diphosphate-sugar epimerase
MPIQNDRLTSVQGDAMNQTDVEKAVQGADAVISVLEHRNDSPKDMQTVAIRNIVAAMQKYGVKRLVSLTRAGVEVPQDKPGLSNYSIKFALKTISGDVLRDAEQHAKEIKNSPLD